MYFHNLMNRDDEELTKSVLLLQMERNYKGDVAQQIKKDLELMDIDSQLATTLSKLSFKELVNKKICNIAFEYLHTLATSHSKVKQELYEDLTGMQYLADPRFTTEQAQMLFKFRTRMFDVRNNFRNNYACTSCPLCGVEEDTQEHLLNCIMIKKEHTAEMKYSDIFCNDCDILHNVVNELHHIVSIREKLMEL